MTKSCFSLLLAAACLAFIAISARGQEQQDPLAGFGVESNLLAGKIIRHSAKFKAPIPASSAAFDACVIWQTYGKKEWHQRRNFPIIGLGMTLTDYGRDDVFGRCAGIYTYIQLPLVRWKHLEWTFRLGDGIAYVTKKFQRTHPADTLNDAIGSNVNDFGIFMTDLRYHVNDHWHMQAGLNLTHISNGYFHTPNLGVNMVGVHMGVQYFPVTNKPKRIIRELPKLKNRWLMQVRAGVGYTEANATGNPELPNYVISGYASKRWLGKNKAFAGIDYAYHEPTYAFYKTWGIHIGHERGNAWDGTIFIGNEFLLGRVGIVAQVGAYYRTTYLNYGNDPLNEKIGANLYLLQRERGLLKELFVSAILTTHTAVAEYAEFGLGIGL